MSPKKRRSSRARCAKRTNRKSHGTATFVPTKKGQVAPANRVAFRQERGRVKAFHGQQVRENIAYIRKEKVKKVRKAIRKVRQATKRVMKSRGRDLTGAMLSILMVLFVSGCASKPAIQCVKIDGEIFCREPK